VFFLKKVSYGPEKIKRKHLNRNNLLNILYRKHNIEY
jgi:hypothetical protein